MTAKSSPMHVMHGMHGSWRRALLGAAAAMLCLCTVAQEAASQGTGQQDPQPQAAQSQPGLQKVGEAKLKVLLWSVYNSRLYTADGAYQEGARPLRLEIEYLIDVKSDRLVDRTLQEWEAIGREHPEQANWALTLRELWPDIQAGDVLTLELAEDDSATFSRNGERLGTVDHPDFGQHFVDIWLSPDSTRPELRLALLGEDR